MLTMPTLLGGHEDLATQAAGNNLTEIVFQAIKTNLAAHLQLSLGKIQADFQCSMESVLA